MKDERIEGSEPAFAQDENGNDRTGFSRREYAAIHPRVPNSGTEWLDNMITQRMRDDFAGQAMVGVEASLVGGVSMSTKECASYSCELADALLAARETAKGDTNDH